MPVLINDGKQLLVPESISADQILGGVIDTDFLSWRSVSHHLTGARVLGE
jgi:hypothetical protein